MKIGHVWKPFGSETWRCTKCSYWAVQVSEPKSDSLIYISTNKHGKEIKLTCDEFIAESVINS